MTPSLCAMRSTNASRSRCASRASGCERFCVENTIRLACSRMPLPRRRRSSNRGAVRELAAALPDGAIVYVSNSMPVRDLDSFLPVSQRPLRVLANRGANGIDGMVSSGLGAAVSQRQPVVLLTGDLAFLHDVGALLMARRHEVNLTIVVFDNDGGGIFSLLPIAKQADPEIFETHFRTPHGADLEPMARAFGAAFTRVTSWEHLRTAVKKRDWSAGGVRGRNSNRPRPKCVASSRSRAPRLRSARARR